MTKSEIIEFLLVAKKKTYAGKGGETTSSRINSHDLKYSENNLLYLDTYLGGEKFAGEEAIWIDNIPYWSMNYCGRVISKEFSGDFLKDALSNVTADKPYRGPEKYVKDDFVYKCTVNGDFEWYHGYEEIYYGEIKVYECLFHGCTIK